jgi:hypothetical protein
VLLFAQYIHVRFIILPSILGDRKKPLGSAPFTCLSNSYSSLFQCTSLYLPQVVYCAVCTKLGNSRHVTTFVVEKRFGLVDKPEPTAGEYNCRQKDGSVVIRTVRWNSLCDVNISILWVDYQPKVTFSFLRYRTRLPQKVIISCLHVPHQ